LISALVCFTMQTTEQAARRNHIILILILGSMTALSPFSIDMYLPAFQAIASDFSTTVARVSLSLSSYFVGLAVGQLFYGPLLDRYGRKRPLYVGLVVFILASLCCLFAKSTEALVAWRLIQALGGCVAGVASMAMVRDLFTIKESAKIYSLLILILGVSPLLAPTIGGYLSVEFGWHSVFLVLALMALVLLLAIRFFLKESHIADPSVSLRIVPIFKGFAEIIKNPQFYTYVFSGAVAFSGLFVYLAGSPVIFLETFKVSAQVYGWIFAIVASGMILASQLNVVFLKRFSNQQVLRTALTAQFLVGCSLCVGTWMGVLGLFGTVAMLFLFMGSFGLTNPNGGALALAPFSKNAGRASALLGFLQMGAGALASTSIGLLGISEMLPVVGVMAGTSFLGLVILHWGTRKISKSQPLSIPH